MNKNSALLTALFKYGNNINSHDWVKIIALTFMVIDHIGAYLLNDNLHFRLLGRLAAPLFFFLIGYQGKLRVNIPLIVGGIILTISSYCVYHHLWINILITFIITNGLLHLFPPQKLSTWQRILFFGVAILLNIWVSLYLEYGFLGTLIAFSARLLALDDREGPFWLLISLIAYFICESLAFGFVNHAHFLQAWALLTALLYLGMLNFTLKEWHLFPAIKWPLLVISRYSLYIYFFHLLALHIYYLRVHGLI